jgi:hypothetical protein
VLVRPGFAQWSYGADPREAPTTDDVLDNIRGDTVSAIVKAAAVQISPVLYSRDGTIENRQADPWAG